MTAFSLIPFGEDLAELSDEQVNHYMSLIHDPQRTRLWREWVKVLDPRRKDQSGRKGLERFVLSKEEQSDQVVQLLTDAQGRVFEKGILIPEASKTNEEGARIGMGPTMLFGYNIAENIIDTRERNHYNDALLDQHVENYFSTLDDIDVMKRVLMSAKEQPQPLGGYYEYKFLRQSQMSESTKALWRKAYYEVFGDEAILSLKTREAPQGRDTRGNRRRYLPPPSEATKSIQEAVRNEDHLESDRLVSLPHPPTAFFDGLVYTSQDFTEALKELDVEIPIEEKEKLLIVLKKLDSQLGESITQIRQDPGLHSVLQRIVPDANFDRNLERFDALDADHIKIKHPAFPALGLAEIEDDEAYVSLNQKLLSNPTDLVGTYLHEIAHTLSDKHDYVLDFQRFFMLLIANRLQLTADNTKPTS